LGATNPAAVQDQLHFEGASIAAGTYFFVFSSPNACPTVAPTPTPSATPSTAAPDNGGGDDDHKLSSWAIVGIIVAAVVVIVGVGIACWKCRSKSVEDGDYSRVA